MKNNKNETTEKTRFLMPKAAIIGALSGFVSGFFGSGGGVIIILGLTLFRLCRGKNLFAQTVLITACYSVCSLFTYSKFGHIDVNFLLPLIPSALIGGICGALLLKRVSPSILKKIFGIITAIGGLIIVFS